MPATPSLTGHNFANVRVEPVYGILKEAQSLEMLEIGKIILSLSDA
jgi:hypothetical protein